MAQRRSFRSGPPPAGRILGVIRRGELPPPEAPLRRGSASKIDPRTCGLFGCPLWREAGGGGCWIGRIRREHFVQGKSIREPEAVPQHGAEGLAVGGDVVFLRTPGAAAAEARKMERAHAAFRRALGLPATRPNAPPIVAPLALPRHVDQRSPAAAR